MRPPGVGRLCCGCTWPSGPPSSAAMLSSPFAAGVEAEHPWRVSQVRRRANEGALGATVSQLQRSLLSTV